LDFSRENAADVELVGEEELLEGGRPLLDTSRSAGEETQ
jgi:hypothetical protein